MYNAKYSLNRWGRMCELWRTRGEWLWRTLWRTRGEWLWRTLLNYNIVCAISALFPSLKWPEGWLQRYYELLKNVRTYILELWCILCRSIMRPDYLDLDSLLSKWLRRLYLPLAIYHLPFYGGGQMVPRSTRPFILCGWKNEYQLTGWVILKAVAGIDDSSVQTHGLSL